MEFNKHIELSNGLIIDYIIVNSIDVILHQSIIITLHYFKSKEYYEKAIQRQNLMREQQELSIKLIDLQTYTDYNQEEAFSLHNKINDLANQIESLPNYEDYLIKTSVVEIPYTEVYDYNYLFNFLKGEL